jgi:hypothetical protein
VRKSVLKNLKNLNKATEVLNTQCSKVSRYSVKESIFLLGLLGGQPQGSTPISRRSTQV